MDLGLTRLQAKVYLALVNVGKTNARTIASVSRVHQPDVYRIVLGLEKSGLVERVIAVPVEYQPKPLDKAVPMLLQHKNRQLSRLKTRSAKLLAENDKKKKPSVPRDETGDIVLVPRGRRHIHRIGGAISQAQTSFVTVCTQDIFRKAKFLDSEIWKKAMRRGVNFRFILDKPEEWEAEPSLNGSSEEIGSFDIRFVASAPPTTVGLIDDREAFVRTAMDIESSVLWVTNPSIVKMIKQYLDLMWARAGLLPAKKPGAQSSRRR